MNMHEQKFKFWMSKPKYNQLKTGIFTEYSNHTLSFSKYFVELTQTTKNIYFFINVTFRKKQKTSRK